MTAQVQLNKSTNQLVTLGLGVNEVASSLLIAKHLGSVFSQTDDARLFQILESQFHVRIRYVPTWLQNVVLERTTPIHGAKMRIIAGFRAMQTAVLGRLEGIATLVVLLARSVESKRVIASLLENLILGGMGSIVDRGDLDRSNLPYNFKPLLESFVQATLDCDSDSAQYRDLRTLLTTLAMEVGPLQNCVSLKRRSNAILHAMSEILGGATMSEEQERQWSAKNLDDFRPPKDQVRVHHTVDITSAYIALAANANGADCVVDIMTGVDKCKRIPAGYKNTLNTFIVTLWACQPPAEIAGILRFASTIESRNYLSQQSPEDRDSEDGTTVFGGDLEISNLVAQEVNYKGGRLHDREQQMAAASLWKKGSQMAEKYRWVVKKAERWSYPLRFLLKASTATESTDAAVSGLVKAFVNKHHQLKSIAPALAMAVHDIYGYTDYKQNDDQDEEWIAAMMIVAVALAVKSLESTTEFSQSMSNKSSRFAFNLSTLRPSGGIHQLLLQAFTQEGVSHQRLLWAAATIWGGASLKTQGYTVVDDSVMGIKAPECTVILEMLCDPLSFFQSGISGKLFRICYGAVPMLPRDPKSGFLKSDPPSSGRDPTPIVSLASSTFPISFSREARRTPINSAATDGISYDAYGPLLPDLVITFEPVITDPSRGLFCAWYVGNLAFEISPGMVFGNSLKRISDNWKPDFRTKRSANEPLMFKSINQMEILGSSGIVVENACGVFNCRGQLGWAVAIAGLADPRVVICKEVPLCDDDLMDRLEEEDILLVL